MSKNIECVFVTVLDAWTGKDENAENECKRTKEMLFERLREGFRIKFVTSSSLENKMLIHYVLEKELV